MRGVPWKWAPRFFIQQDVFAAKVLTIGGINMGKEKQAITQAQLQQIQELAETIRYGSITLVFQDGVLIQIDKSEKIRLAKP